MDNTNHNQKDISNSLVRNFWILVIIFNTGIFMFSLGIMLIGFQNKWDIGVNIMLVGIISFIYGIYRYKICKEKLSTS